MICFWYFSLHLVSFPCSLPPAPSLHFNLGKRLCDMTALLTCARNWAREETMHKWPWMAKCLPWRGLHPHQHTDLHPRKSNLLPASGQYSLQGILARSFLPELFPKGNKLEERQRCFGILFWLEPEPRAVITLDFLANSIERIPISLFQNVYQFDSR